VSRVDDVGGRSPNGGGLAAGIDGASLRRGTSMDRTTRFGLLWLAAAMCLPTAGSAQQGRPYSFDQVAQAIAAGAADSVLEQVTADCVSFVIDTPTEARLRAAGADERFVTALRDVCHVGSSLEVTSEPAGLEVWLQRTLLGRTPLVSAVPPTRGAVIEVRVGDQWRRVVTDIPADRLVRVQVRMPLDTLPVPAALATKEVETLRARATGFDPARRFPAPPPAPVRTGSLRSVLVGGLVGVAVGAAVGAAACRHDVYTYTDDPNFPGVKRPTGPPRSELKGGCVGFSSAMGVAGGGLVGRLWSELGWRRQQREYAQASRALQQSQARWEEQRRAAATLGDEAKRAAERDRVVAENGRRKRLNEASAAPVVRIEAPIWLQRAAMGGPSR
jgi:hypothetical protein